MFDMETDFKTFHQLKSIIERLESIADKCDTTPSSSGTWPWSTSSRSSRPGRPGSGRTPAGPRPAGRRHDHGRLLPRLKCLHRQQA